LAAIARDGAAPDLLTGPVARAPVPFDGFFSSAFVGGRELADNTLTVAAADDFSLGGFDGEFSLLLV
jgi:hypothetical protein